MAERTVQRVVGGKLVPKRPQVPADSPALPDAAVAWTGTPLKTALALAQQAAQGSEPVAQSAETEDGRVLGSDASGADESSQPLGRTLGGEAMESAHGAAGSKDPRARGAVGTRGGEGQRGVRSKGPSGKANHAFAAARAVARKLALQAIYRWLLNDAPWQDLVKEFGEAEDMPNADPQYFREMVEGVWASRKSLDERLGELLDRPVEQLDPVEHAVLLVGLYELSARPDVPYRVAINEAVGLAKRFGATDGHKFVNAVLDRAARILRPGEN
jgi:N utilization substance protein B